MIERYNRIAKDEGLAQRQSYVRVSKKLLRDSYFEHHRHRKKAKKSRRKLRTIGECLLWELERNLPDGRQEDYQGVMHLGWQVITQQRTDTNKIYNLYKPSTACIAKGKAQKNYEFGNKVGIIVHLARRIVLSVGLLVAFCAFQYITSNFLRSDYLETDQHIRATKI